MATVISFWSRCAIAVWHFSVENVFFPQQQLAHVQRLRCSTSRWLPPFALCAAVQGHRTGEGQTRWAHARHLFALLCNNAHLVCPATWDVCKSVFSLFVIAQCAGHATLCSVVPVFEQKMKQIKTFKEPCFRAPERSSWRPWSLAFRFTERSWGGMPTHGSIRQRLSQAWPGGLQ